MDKQKILIVDDSEMNRSILADMLGDEYEIIEAENGSEGVAALQKYGSEVSLVLLDIVMPEMDGFGMLTVMNRYRWIDEIPVIMISAERGSSHVERAFELGITDFISRPFDALIVHHRVVNTILLYAKQKKLEGLVADQIYEKEHRSTLMIDILSSIVEFRNGESGLHVRHVHTLTEILLNVLVHKTDRYDLSQTDISIISTASALHDIGKIAIAEEVLNKPGKLTDEEFAIMKTHSMVGANMLAGLPIHQEEPLVKAAYEIARWHHERYDGRGYPDGLKGDDIPISAQIVALADVYDALTSERVYKKAFPHEVAVEMILEGKCGVFNPLVLDCLRECADNIPTELGDDNAMRRNQREMRNIAREMHKHEELSASERTLQLLEHERMKYSFFAAMTEEVQFEYTTQPPMVTLTAWGAEKLGLDEIIMDPEQDQKAISLLGQDGWRELSDILHATNPANPVVKYDCMLHFKEEPRWMRIVARAIWSSDEPPRYTGAIGKAIDIHDSRTRMNDLEHQATHDALTGLLNHSTARKRIVERLQERPDGRYALIIVDLDHFKRANDNYGHMFGDQVLIHLAGSLRQNIRGGDIAARVGGDEMLLFIECKLEIEPAVERIFTAITGQYEDFPISVSMGVAKAEELGTDYDRLFQAADKALYTVKRSGRGHYRFYDDSMEETLSVISPIDGDTEGR
ncbi:MAG: diguanylate cyclase [Ruminiclostridium sp.]|jgi:diguanylate cyclase (GGDEF)-like protein|nr:diguanylate cyclase [Ruminiclostridium sp.]